MNEILRDLINKEKVAAFVDNVLVGTKTKEGHDEKIGRKQLVCQAREMCVESKEDWIPRGHHRT